MSVLERVYYFHGELSRNRYPNARTLMAEFEISLATARRDIAYLRDRLLAPVAFDARRNGFYYTDDGFRLPFENNSRIYFLLGMLSRLAEETGLSGLAEIRQLESRLAALTGQDYQHLIDSIHCEWIEIEHPDPAIFDTILEAMVQQRELAITYRSPQKQTTDRNIEPVRLINYQGRWYLSAWCLLRDESRLFHLARIIQAQPGQHSIPARKHGAADLERSFGIFKGTPAYRAEIHFTGTAAEVVRHQIWHKDQEIIPAENGIELHLPVNDDRELIMKILQYGAHAKILYPRRLADRIAAEISAMSENYQQS
jgi:predicted DNA-binding transcriptional regulator YafY